MSALPRMETTVERSGPVAVVVVTGPVDVSNAFVLARALAGEAEHPIVLDLCGCTFMDSTGFSVLIPYRRHPHGFAIACLPKGPVERLIGLVAGSWFELRPDREAAIDAVRGAATTA